MKLQVKDIIKFNGRICKIHDMFSSTNYFRDCTTVYTLYFFDTKKFDIIYKHYNDTSGFELNFPPMETE